MVQIHYRLPKDLKGYWLRLVTLFCGSGAPAIFQITFQPSDRREQKYL
jgi:hypothetical protein